LKVAAKVVCQRSDDEADTRDLIVGLGEDTRTALQNLLGKAIGLERRAWVLALEALRLEEE